MVKVTRGETENRQTVLHIEVDDQQVDRHMQRAHQKVVQRVNIPGFRKGKAPRSIVERFVGREYLIEEALETLVPDVVNDAIESEQIEAAATPRVNVVSREPVIKLDATVALEPEATLGDYHSIRVDDNAEPVTEEQVDAQLNQLREAHATWEPVERAVELGDLVTLNVQGIVDGEHLFDQDDAEYLADEENPNPVPGFSGQVVGLSSGESKQFSLTVPEGYRQSELVGKEVEFTVAVSSVKGKILPDLDDDLAKNLGEGLDTFADLRIRLRKNLEAAADRVLRESLEEKVVDELVAAAKFEVSPILIEHEAEHILTDQQQALARYNISFDQYLQGSGKSGDEFIVEARESAERRLHRSLVIDELAKAEEVEAAAEEIDAEIERMKSDPQYKEAADLDSEEARNAVTRMLRRRAALDRIIEMAQQDGAKSETNGSPKASASSGSKASKSRASGKSTAKGKRTKAAAKQE